MAFWGGILIGLGVAVFIYYKQKKTKEIVYEVKCNEIFSEISKKIPGLKIEYEKEKIENLWEVRFAIWNSGNSAIKREDIGSKVLKIEVPKNFKPVSANFQVGSSFDNQLQYTIPKKKGKAAEFDFEFLNSGQGCVFQIIHSGEEVNSNDFKISGSIIDGKPIRRILENNKRLIFWTRVAKFSGLILMVLLLANIGWGIYAFFNDLPKILTLIEQNYPKYIWPYYSISWGSIALLILSLILREVSKEVPKAFREIYNKF